MKYFENRFVKTSMQQHGMANRTYVLVDRETGVNYLLAGFLASSGGMSVLVDQNGNPIVTPVDDEE